MSKQHKKHQPPPKPATKTRKKFPHRNLIMIAAGVVLLATVVFAFNAKKWFGPKAPVVEEQQQQQPVHTKSLYTNIWLQRARLVGEQFHRVYSAGWEGANGAIGDAYLFKATGDSALLRYHTVTHDMRLMFNGTWVDDRAWIGLAEMYWWDATGRTNSVWVEDTRQRYLEAKKEGRLSNHEGFWSWYNWPKDAKVQDRIFTNSNMNHMVSVACWLYEATKDKQFLDDALLVWNGDGKLPGVEKVFYKGDGVWKGKSGLAAFGKQLPWEGTEYCSVAASLYRVTKDPKYKKIIIATARRIMDPKTGWVDPEYFYQIKMDGNGAFVHYLMDAYEVAPEELADIPVKVGKMLEHVWTNHFGKATVTLHRTADHGIRNGWNPNGGEDGYGVDLVGASHPQSQANRAFGVYAYFMTKVVKGQ
jgi:hypothetical protein